MKRYLAVLLAMLLGMPSTLYADSLSISAWSTGDALNATNLNSRHTTIQNLINGNLANDNIKSSAGIVGSKLDLTSGTGRISHSTSVTDDAPILTSAQTWDDVAEVFSGWRLTVTNTNSASTSRLLDLRVGSTIIASVSRTGQFILTPQAYASGPTTMMEGAWFNIASATMTDNRTAASGTAPRFIAYAFQRPAIAAANSSVTTSDAATVFIASAPVAGDNMTLTNRYALWVDQGNVRVGGTIMASGSVGVTGSITASGSIGIGTNTPFRFVHIYSGAAAGSSASLLVEESGPRVEFRQNGQNSVTANQRTWDIGATLIQSNRADFSISTLNDDFSNRTNRFVITRTGIVTAGIATPSGGTAGDFMAANSLYASGSAFIQGELHIGGQGSGANALWVDASVSRFDGRLHLNTASSTTGTATATLGTNAPVGQTTPFVWLSVIASDGTAVFVPAWR